MTPHINAKKNEIAKKVLMPGDPLRAKWVAEKYLKNCKLVNSVRNMFGYTGTYKNIEVTVMAHGMGIPSIGIYSTELFKFYNADVIYRIGSSGSIDKDTKIHDVIVVDSAYSPSCFAEWIGINAKNSELFPTKSCLDNIIETAKINGIKAKLARVVSEDTFYGNKDIETIKKLSSNAVALEMEAFGLFAVAQTYNKKAACLLTISDSLITHESLSSEDRQKSFDKMVLLALESIIKE